MKNIEITEAMVRAGLRVLSNDYNNSFDPLENDARHFVSRLFLEMQKAQSQSPGLTAGEHE